MIVTETPTSLIARRVLRHPEDFFFPLANENSEERLWAGQRNAAGFGGKVGLVAFDPPLPLLSVQRAASPRGLLPQGRYRGS